TWSYKDVSLGVNYIDALDHAYLTYRLTSICEECMGFARVRDQLYQLFDRDRLTHIRECLEGVRYQLKDHNSTIYLKNRLNVIVLSDVVTSEMVSITLLILNEGVIGRRDVPK
ncbi:unnamed protein product, partial [Dovyalis caffra]